MKKTKTEVSPDPCRSTSPGSEACLKLKKGESFKSKAFSPSIKTMGKKKDESTGKKGEDS
jgi:hypothetical protein